ncbi:tail protein [Colwellia phage 9A]|uniref:Tail component protein n=1 Tax=Colwellia phage 9A TaxID=765765 RepID=I3UMD6_9CAUD|nr:tail protein [Colwellia phage 9A]AFK66651.1 tail component protein [Colwellia phage 9A]
MITDIEVHALEAYPEECVGYVANGTYHRMVNVSNVPTKQYQLSPKDKMKLFSLGKNLTALVHSHPILDNRPSGKDLAAQKATGFAFWIIGTDGTQITKLWRSNNEDAN